MVPATPNQGLAWQFGWGFLQEIMKHWHSSREKRKIILCRGEPSIELSFAFVRFREVADAVLGRNVLKLGLLSDRSKLCSNQRTYQQRTYQAEGPCLSRLQCLFVFCNDGMHALDLRCLLPVVQTQSRLHTLSSPYPNLTTFKFRRFLYCVRPLATVELNQLKYWALTTGTDTFEL